MPHPESESQPTLFATTRWTLVVDAASGEDSVALEALGALFQTYWQPLYRYARRKGKSREDAEDLVQGFLAHLLGGSGLENIDQSKGRFRAFLLASFNHWMINEWKRATRQKRGGGVAPLSFNWDDAESGLQIEATDAPTPDRMFDREWALALLAKVLDELEASARADGSGARFAGLKSCLTADSQRIRYAGLAAEMDMSEGAVRVAVHRLRKRYRRALRAEIARTLASPDAVDEEMQALFAALAG